MVSFDSSRIVNWANNPNASHLFPELVRRLILSSAPLPDLLNMPSGSSVRMGGWDGLLAVSAGNPWIPLGKSAWELSCEKSPKQKADGDYDKRTQDPKGALPLQTTYVCVTSRKFSNKEAWAGDRRKEGAWADVRVLDADDLVAWLAASPTVSEWFARLIGQIPDSGVIPLENWWESWASMTQPTTSPELVLAGRKEEMAAVADWVKGTSSHWFVQGDTRDEAIAFLAASAISNLEEWGSTVLARALVVDTHEAWRSLEHHNFPLVLVPKFVNGSAPQIAVREGHHVLTPLDASEEALGNGCTLSRLGRDETSSALTEMDLPEPKVNELVEKTARRLSILRRFLVEEAGHPMPSWAASASGTLVALVLVGQWEVDNAGDREFVENLTGRSYGDVEEELVTVAGSPDSPVVRVDRKWRFTSHEDVWNILAQRMTDTRATRFGEMASTVLAQTSPQFELPLGERYMGPVLGKILPHSSTIREGMSRTLALMGTYPERAKNIESVRYLPVQVVSKALSAGKGWEIWATLSHELPALAEAAPDAFLDAVERDLSASPSPFEDLFGQVGHSLFDGTPYTGLLWALERLAWSADHFSRVAMILARLAEFERESNIVNRPTESLHGLFAAGLRFTEVPDAERLETLIALVDRHPQRGWELAIRTYPTNGRVVEHRRLPHWRPWGQDVSIRQTQDEFREYLDAIEEFLFCKVQDDAKKWTDFTDLFPRLSLEARLRVLCSLLGQANNLREQQAGKELWDKIRFVLNRHRSFPEASWAMTEDETASLYEAYDRLTPEDPVIANSWLFFERPAFPDPTPAESTSLEEERKRADDAQRGAVRSIHSIGGDASIIRLAELARNSGAVGRAVARALEVDLSISLALPHVGSSNWELRDFARGAMFALSRDLGWEPLGEMLKQLKASDAKPSHIAEVFLCAAANRDTWALMAIESPETQEQYWNSVQPYTISPDNDDDFRFGIQRIIDCGRSPDVIDLLAYVDGQIELVLKVLAQLPTDHSKQIEEGRQSITDGYSIGALLKKLDQSQYVADAVIAALEIPFLLVLDHQQRQLALHREVMRQPSLYADLLSWVFKRSDGLEDAEEETRERRAEVGLQVLWNLRGLPGTSESGEVDKGLLNTWVDEARRLCKERGREAIGDKQIGQLLANSPRGEDGLWPCEPVRDLLDALASQQVGRGFTTGKFNLRGVTTRGTFEGGGSERALAEAYREDATKMTSTWPFTAQLLRKLAGDFELSGRQFDRDLEWRDQFQA